MEAPFQVLLKNQRLEKKEMDWTQHYQSHKMSAADAVRLIKSGQRVFMTGNCSVPHALLAALVEYAPELHDVEICQALTVANGDYVTPAMEGHLRVNTLFIGRRAHAGGASRHRQCACGRRASGWRRRRTLRWLTR